MIISEEFKGEPLHMGMTKENTKFYAYCAIPIINIREACRKFSKVEGSSLPSSWLGSRRVPERGCSEANRRQWFDGTQWPHLCLSGRCVFLYDCRGGADGI